MPQKVWSISLCCFKMSGFSEATRSRLSDNTCYSGCPQKQDYLLVLVAAYFVYLFMCYNPAFFLNFIGVSWYQPSDEDNLLLSSAGEDGSICIWKANDLSLLFEQNAHQVLNHFIAQHYFIFTLYYISGTKSNLPKLVIPVGKENLGFSQ